MIPQDHITEWRARAPWIEDFQVEQDLVISRALAGMFSDPFLAQALAFRGGTALYKLYLTPPARYSEDIDLVQIAPGPAGPLMDDLRNVLDPWLGEARWKQSKGRRSSIRRRHERSSYKGLRVAAGGSGANGLRAADPTPSGRGVEKGDRRLTRAEAHMAISLVANFTSNLQRVADSRDGVV